MKRIAPDDNFSTRPVVRHEADQHKTTCSSRIAPRLISALPRELQEEILQWLAPRDLLNLGQASKWYFKRCEEVYLSPRPREKFQSISFHARDAEVALSRLWEKYARPGIDLLGQEVSTVTTRDAFRTFQTVVVPRAARWVHTLWIEASELAVHMQSLPLKAGFTRLRINIDSSAAWQSICDQLAGRSMALDSVELIFQMDNACAPGSIDVRCLGTALKALTFHSSMQINALFGSLDGVETLGLDADFFGGWDPAPVIGWVKNYLPNLKELSVMASDEGVRQLLNAMPGIHTLSLDHVAVEELDIEGALTSGVRHLLLSARAADAEQWKNLISPTYQVNQLESLELAYLEFPHLQSLSDLLSRLPALRRLKLEDIALKEKPDEEKWIEFIQTLSARPGLDLNLVEDGRA